MVCLRVRGSSEGVVMPGMRVVKQLRSSNPPRTRVTKVIHGVRRTLTGGMLSFICGTNL